MRKMSLGKGQAVHLRRFWFEFEHTPQLPSVLLMGCGVSASSRDVAEAIISKRLFKGAELPTCLKVIEDIDISTLDPNHVLPNMGVVVRSGIWFPIGYQEQLVWSQEPKTP